VRVDEVARRGGREQQDAAGGALRHLFPASPPSAARSPGRLLACVAAQLAAVALGAAALLFRIPGLPSWDTIYGEDYWEFFRQALQQPWHLFLEYNGYEQLVPRVLAQFAAYLPLPEVTPFLTVSGTVVAAACGLFVFHASAGHVRSAGLRALLGVAVVLLPIAPMEIADSGVNTPWYLLLAMFWALLWRPRTPAGMAVAAFVAFAAASSNSVNALFVPMAAARLYALRRPREQAATAGWVAGCLVQIPEVLPSYWSGHSRLANKPGPFGHSLAFYAHDVVLPSLGWHLALALEWLVGRDGATMIVALILAAIIVAIVITQPENRLFVVNALLAGFFFSMFGTTLTPHLAIQTVSAENEPGSRYTALPIFVIECIAVVGVDYARRRRPVVAHRHRGARLRPARLRPARLRPAWVVSALVVILAANWIADFRYAGIRSNASWDWGPIAARWEHACEQSRSGVIVEKAGPDRYSLPCTHIAPYRGPRALPNRKRSLVTDMCTRARR
jgi:hypothetical protein